MYHNSQLACASICPSLWFEIGGTKGDKRLFESLKKEESTKYEKKFRKGNAL